MGLIYYSKHIRLPVYLHLKLGLLYSKRQIDKRKDGWTDRYLERPSKKCRLQWPKDKQSDKQTNK